MIDRVQFRESLFNTPNVICAEQKQLVELILLEAKLYLVQITSFYDSIFGKGIGKGRSNTNETICCKFEFLEWF